ncbi:MAG: SBBP repeat-containing protein, partial [Caldilineaceae bacterium]|nr:SBBP repeat-containing protein [Caldilineaceae bacterium]
ETILTSAGASDIFVATYDTNGALLWATRAGSASDEWGNGIGVDGVGNSYATGFFQGSATFGSGEIHETILTSAGWRDIFVAKYGVTGALLWAKQAGGTDWDYANAVAVDGNGNSYVIGSFQGNATFGPGETHETTLTSVGSDDIFVTKYDASGALVWATQAGGTGGDRGLGIAVDGLGNSYVTGRFQGSATFGASGAAQAGSIHAAQAAATVLTSAGSDDIFVAKYIDVPLAVTLGYFLATPSEEDVRIEWSTATETGNAGFNLYVETETGRQQINPALIPSTVIDSLEPQRYAYDVVGVQGDFFFIELVNVNGGSRMFGPFALGVPFGAEPAAEEEGYHIFLPSVLKY